MPGPPWATTTGRPPFDLLPAVDLLGGRVVRLRRGDPAAATVYSSDPAAAVRRWAAAGAGLLHVVDLDRALAVAAPGQGPVESVIGACTEAGIACEVAGGLRDEETVDAVLAVGAARVVLGTALLAHPELLERLVARYGGGRVVAALDVRAGRAVGEGWRSGAPGTRLDRLVGRLLAAGAGILEVTSIARDGTMAGPDLELLARVRALAPNVLLIASGGIRDVRDLRALHDLGCDGAILGRAIYDGAFTLADARAALGQ